MRQEAYILNNEQQSSQSNPNKLLPSTMKGINDTEHDYNDDGYLSSPSNKFQPHLAFHRRYTIGSSPLLV